MPPARTAGDTWISASLAAGPVRECQLPIHFSREYARGMRCARTRSALSKRHDELQTQVAKTVPQQAKTQDLAPTVKKSGQASNTVSSPAPDAVSSTLSSLHSLSLRQRTIAGLDRRIQDEQTLANIYGQWAALVASRRRGLLHGLIASIAWMLLIVLVVFAFNRAIAHFFDHL